MNGLDEPKDALADQRLALLRVCLYGNAGLNVTQTVLTECQRIRDANRAAFHESWIHTLFGEPQSVDQERIDVRTTELLALHGDTDDCRILAECEDSGLAVLLSFDTKFIGRLGRFTAVNLLRPLDYWVSLKIPRGAKPFIVPRHDNPLASESWWRW